MNIKCWHITCEVEADFGSECHPYIRKNMISCSSIPKLSNRQAKFERNNPKENSIDSGDF